ncbi:uncharacterized protein LOC121376902 [Gigantopelta aegis]|uniref:uncharacterized protein LOC121376902 n=1 Tax=Gigantopelta aegis TaxID=1735272 RepID=UPI001B88DF90|nr:uncharacterized protein LOC121376902 [Gigantopelta aegis]
MKRTCIEDKTKTWEPAEHDRVCSKHFITGRPVDDDDHPDYVPSIFIFSPVRESTPNKVSRYHRVKQRREVLQTLDEEIQQEQNRNDVANILMDLTHNICTTTFTDTGTDPIPEEPSPLQDEFFELQRKYSQLQTEYQRVLDHNRELKDEIQKKKFTFSNLDNAKISALTGLCSVAVFMWVLSLVSLCIKRIGNVSPGDQLLLVLMKLRLNLTNRDLALRFNICPTQVSKILGQCLPRNLNFLYSGQIKIQY